MSIARPQIDFRTRQVVYQPMRTEPFVGYEHLTSRPEGFKFDIKRWSSILDMRLPLLPRLADPALQGLREEEYFLSGVADTSIDLALTSIERIATDLQRQWLPITSSGYYYRYAHRYFYYSDNSRVQYVDPADNRNERSYIALDVDPAIDTPILAATFARKSEVRTPTYKTWIKQQYDFTGLYSDGEELETVTPLGKILWDNIDTTKREFVVDHTKAESVILWFNKDYTHEYGVTPVSYSDLGANQVLGASTGSNYQAFYLPHFPVLADDSFELYVADATTWSQWERVDTWWQLIETATSGASANKYYLDSDLGIIYFGSHTHGGVPTIGNLIVAKYTTTLRIEYEELDSTQKVIAWDADVNPITQHRNQGFVCITHELLEPANISLTVNKSKVEFTANPIEHGPVYVGSDYAILRATVTNNTGVAAPGTHVGFEMTPQTIGSLNGSTEASAATNGSGHAFSSYQPPISANSLGYYSVIVRDCTNPYYPDSREIVLPTTANPGLIGQEDDIYTYQVLKDDLLLGYDSLDDFIYSDVAPPAWVKTDEDYAQWKSELIADYDLHDWTGVNPVDGSLSGRKVVLYQVEHALHEDPYDQGVNNYDPDAINPVTGEDGAIRPVRPTLVEKITDAGDDYYGHYRLIYPEAAVPICDPDNSNNPIGGYWVISNRLLTVQAHCWSPFYNRNIYSNEITLRISLPPYLLGEYVTANLENIPFGWKIFTDTDNIAAGIDGATFITINPHSGPYQILDLVNGTTPVGAPEGWANAPFRSIGFQLKINNS